MLETSSGSVDKQRGYPTVLLRLIIAGTGLCAFSYKNDEFCITMRNCALKARNVLIKMMDFADAWFQTEQALSELMDPSGEPSTCF